MFGNRFPLSVSVLFLIAAVLQIVWGLVPTASRIVINEIPVELYTAIRWTVSALLFATYLTVFKKWKKMTTSDLVWVSLLGVLGYGVASIGTLYGLKLGGVVHFAMTAALSPIVVSILSLVFLHEKPRKIFYLALFLSMAGLALLSLGKARVSSFTVVGLSVALILSACILEGVVFIFSKRFKQKVDTVQFLAVAQGAAAAFMWLLQGSVFHQVTDLSNLSARGLWALIFVSVVGCVFCYLVLYWLLNYIEGHRLALFDGLHAVSASVFGFALFGEVVNGLMLAGGLAILFGLLLGNLPRSRRTPEVL